MALLPSGGSRCYPWGIPLLSAARIPALDGLRGVAILLVLVCHAVGVTGTTDPISAVLRHGFLGVDLFFVLSGFLITGILLDSQPGSYRPFYARRVLRIFPVYLATVAVLVWLRPPIPVLDGQGTVADLQAWYWLHVTNWRIVLHPDLRLPENTGPFWSLAVEEQWYLLWPAVVWAVGIKRLAWLCLLLVGVAVLGRLAVLLGDGSYRLMRAATPMAMDGLAMGAMLAVWHRSPVWPRVAGLASPVLVLATLTTVALLWWGPFGSPRYPATSVPLFLTASLAFAALLVLTVERGWFTSPTLRTFGWYSYAIYLLHFFLLACLAPHAPRFGPVVFVSGFVALSLVLGWLSWHLWERHWLALKGRVPMPAARAAPAPTVPQPPSSGSDSAASPAPALPVSSASLPRR